MYLSTWLIKPFKFPGKPISCHLTYSELTEQDWRTVKGHVLSDSSSYIVVIKLTEKFIFQNINKILFETSRDCFNLSQISQICSIVRYCTAPKENRIVRTSIGKSIIYKRHSWRKYHRLHKITHSYFKDFNHTFLSVFGFGSGSST